MTKGSQKSGARLLKQASCHVYSAKYGILLSVTIPVCRPMLVVLQACGRIPVSSIVQDHERSPVEESCNPGESACACTSFLIFSSKD